jgi:hypothetical protein
LSLPTEIKPLNAITISAALPKITTINPGDSAKKMKIKEGKDKTEKPTIIKVTHADVTARFLRLRW